MELVYQLQTPGNCNINKLPKHCTIGNLVQEKKYQEAINLGEELLRDSNSNKAMVYINLMVAYQKVKDTENTLRCAKGAINEGHTTGMALERLAIILERQHLFLEAIEVCDIALDDNYYFSLYSGGDERKQEFRKRKERLLKRASKDKRTIEYKPIFYECQRLEIIRASFDSYNAQVDERNGHIDKYGWDSKKSKRALWKCNNTKNKSK